MADVPVLVCTAGPLAGQSFIVPEEGELSIGRAEDNGVVIPDKDVSRYHAHLRLDNGSLWLRDAGSRNGVFVNDNRVTDHHALRVGDVIRIAEHEFDVRWLADEEDTQSIHGAPRPDGAGGKWWWPFK